MSKQSDSNQKVMSNETANPQNVEESNIDKSEYIYELPSWDLMPPATFVIRRVRRL